MLVASRPAAIREHHERGDQEDADDAHRDGDRHARERRERDVQEPDREAADARALLVERNGDEPAVENADDGQPDRAEHRDEGEV